MEIQHCIVGKEGVDFGSRVGRPERVHRIREELKARGIKKVFLPDCAFTTRIVELGNNNEEPWGSEVVWTKEKADGVVVSEPNVAVGLCNGDCPAVIIHDTDTNRLILLHCGTRCLIPKHDDSIILHAFRQYKLNPKRVRIIVGYGVGPCCYGIGFLRKIIFQVTNFPRTVGLPVPYELKFGVACKGPRRGKTSLDLYNLIRKQLSWQLEVPRDNIEINDSCTACAGYHSYSYKGKNAGRNLVLAWMA